CPPHAAMPQSRHCVRSRNQSASTGRDANRSSPPSRSLVLTNCCTRRNSPGAGSRPPGSAEMTNSGSPFWFQTPTSHPPSQPSSSAVDTIPHHCLILGSEVSAQRCATDGEVTCVSLPPPVGRYRGVQP